MGGKDKKYVTGSGATRQTRNRINVYHNLTGIEKQSKPVMFVNSVFQYLSDSANSSASSSDEKGTEAEDNAGFWPGPTQSVLKNFESTLDIAGREKRRLKNSKKNGVDGNRDVKNEGDNKKNDPENTSSFSPETDSSSSGPLEVTKACHSVPSVPDITISTVEIKSNDNSVSCKTTKVSREFTDAVTGVFFKCELARGVSVTQQSVGSFDLFDNLDLLGEHLSDDPSTMDVSDDLVCNSLQRQATRDRSEFDMHCIAMLQEL